MVVLGILLAGLLVAGGCGGADGPCSSGTVLNALGRFSLLFSSGLVLFWLAVVLFVYLLQRARGGKSPPKVR
jgi:hypothetical protein